MKLTTNLGPRSYDIVIKRGVLGKVGLLANLAGKVLIVCDDGVPAACAKKLAAQCGQAHHLVLPAGEANKNMAAVAAVLEKLQAEHFGPHDVVAALGGGLVGDIAGFAAACYRRGVPYCQLPTTTTAQLDAAVGGRTGVNLGGGLSNVGTWYQPALVAIDPDLLKTLPDNHYASGLAQALKTGLAASRELFELLEQLEDYKKEIERIIYLCVRTKKSLVESDETDGGQRRLLSFGYTFGQAAEAAGGTLLHGECVGLGMLPMIESRTLQRRTRAVMKKMGLPLKNPLSAEQMMPFVRAGAENGQRRVVRVKAPGQGYLENLDLEELSLLLAGQ